MSLAPDDAWTRKSNIVLQPAYFTSALFVDPLRDDIQSLLAEFESKCNGNAESGQGSGVFKPFDAFKKLWEERKWTMFHLKAIDDRGRKTFLDTTLRLFVERTSISQPPLIRLGALFGLYIFWATQPRASDVSLFLQPYIPIPSDTYANLNSLPSVLDAPFAVYASHILSCLTKPSTSPPSNAFQIIPPTSFNADNPRQLPHTSIKVVPKTDKKKTGRPTASDKQKKASKALTELDKWAVKINSSADAPTPTTANQSDKGTKNKEKEKEKEKEKALFQPPSLKSYIASKDQLALNVRTDMIEAAEDMTWKKMKDVDRYAKDQGLSTRRDGLEKVEKARAEVGGLLALAENEARLR